LRQTGKRWLAVVRAKPGIITPSHRRGNHGVHRTDTDGITVEPCSGGWNLQFSSALFDRDDHLKIGSKAQIESVAKALVRTQAKMHVQIVGYADNEPPTWPWSNPLSDAQLGQLRAERIKQILAQMSLFPATALCATNGASGDLLHPGDSRRNRTVVLRILQPD
jgi:flagellar motor protein MotB